MVLFLYCVILMLICEAVFSKETSVYFFLSLFIISLFFSILFSFLSQLWIEERMPLAMSEEHGHNLQTVQMLLKKNQVGISL